MAKKKSSEEHDVLYHYTTIEGFRGIMEHQTLWATHVKCLNDASELERLNGILIKIIIPIVKKVLKKWRAEGHSGVKQAIRHVGSRDGLARHEAEALSTALYESAFVPIGDNSHPMFEPFITSFCSHLKDDAYTRAHGLLSMWRSYGSDGGVALVLEKAALETHLSREAEEYGHLIFQIDDVVYEDDTDQLNAEFGEFIEIAKKIIYLHLSGEDVSYTTFLVPYLESIGRLKHQAFKEEREVRIVTMPWSEQSGGVAGRETKKIKQLHTRVGRHGDIQYLELFDGKQAPPRLPIRKIIVGPHHDQLGRFEEINKATKHLQGVEVTCSETPLIER